MNNPNHKTKRLSAMRGILWLLPLISMFGILIYRPNNKQAEPETKDTTETAIAKPTTTKYRATNQEVINVKLSIFDPNTADYKAFRTLGLTKSQSVSIIKYREAGKIFRIKEDLATCYGITDSIYYLLEPYIKIGDKYKIKRRVSTQTQASNSTTQTQQGEIRREEEKRDSLFTFDPNTISRDEFMLLGFSVAETETFLKYRGMVGRFTDVDRFLKCYSVRDRASELMPYISIKPLPKLELNGADSIQLCDIDGIGAISAKAIIDYRNRLGGFVKIEQLSEIKQVTERNFEKILQQIYVDSVVITKIDINFVASEQLAMSLLAHPYAGRLIVRKLLKQRQLKGGWCTIGELVEQDILTLSQAEQLAPYLHFANPTTID